MTDPRPAEMLAALRLLVPPDELAELAAQYPTVRASLDLLYDPAFAAADPLLYPTLAPFAP